MKNKKGISLIVLIITIIVVIILAAVVILTLSKNNPIESAKEARFKEDVRIFQDELAMSVSKQYAQTGGKRDTKIYADKYTKDEAEDSVYTYITSFKEKYNKKLVIQKDELKYIVDKVSDTEKKLFEELNVKSLLLPIQYQQVEYIESTGIQYIDTKIVPETHPDLYVEIKGNYTKIVDTDQFIFGSNKITGPYVLMGQSFKYGNNGFISQMGGGGTEKTLSAADTNNHVFCLNIKLSQAAIDSKIVELSKNINGISYTYYIFTKNKYNNEPSSLANFKMYYCNISENSIKIRTFIPCYTTTTVTNVDGEICNEGTAGLYDLVEGKFYTNKGDKTKGDFVCGPEV